MANQELLTPEDTANFLGIRTHTLATWRCTGRYGLPFIKIGRAIRYRRADVEAWLAANQSAGVK
jgi:excisionase family DNA binding protein